ncbi:ADP-heptose--LPS heptosyltransferase [Curvibacter sp. CHRR-16]|uniref:glycosyltransferase family 9 protein n=1 Tax=Curvibacter sp. CHRR-16 TaxID=2835872 RepID=UPI001BDACB2F|nr:ADP-heptose--LPS heptosyltransferase [Curvibacter sp. CHRR-16]MBT0571497.1 ADP-heptose--LPS heptosyltransferase [Curvibacter sp. CHRR-16]
MHTADNPAAQWGQQFPQLRAQAIVDSNGMVWLPFDAANTQQSPHQFSPLSACYDQVCCANRTSIDLDFGNIGRLLIINGFGLAFGDSVIGITALHALLQRHPHLQVSLWRSSTCPAYVEALYNYLPKSVSVTALPQPAERLAAFDAVIDLSDFLFWQSFNDLPMIDFFLHAIGLPYADIPAAEKANSWLASIAPVHDWRREFGDYVLFCPHASVALRSIPERWHAPMVERLHAQFDLPVLGFANLDLPGYRNVSALSTTIAQWLDWVRHAQHVVSVDSASIHLAAGFGIPSTGYFVSIPPQLRTRDYPLCQSIWLDAQQRLTGLHESNVHDVIIYAESLWPEALKLTI